MSDHHALSVLVTRLGRWLDDGCPGDGHDLFTADVEVRTAGGVSKGIDAVVAQARRNHRVPTQHFITDPLVDVNGDRAAIDANLLAVFAGEDGPRLLGERYALEAVRTGGEWRLSRIEARPVWEVAHV